jgi:hypothetical protein
MDSHEEYLELCAASTAGELSADEEQKVREHLAVCASCRRATHQYESAIREFVPALANVLASNLEKYDPAWSIEDAEAAFFKRLETDQNTRHSRQGEQEGPQIGSAGRRFTYRPSRIPWAELWMPVAACALLAIALGIVAYRSGLRRGADRAQKQAVTTTPSPASLEEQVSDAGHERAQVMAARADDEQAIKHLKQEVAEKNDEIKRLRAVNDSAAAIGSAEISRRDAEIAVAQTNLQELQARADALSEQRAAAAKHAVVLEAKVDELTQGVRDRDQALDQQQAQMAKQQELLDHDRDIRELMGARELYIAEVHDVGGSGETDKTYGRVFYTKGKSLIFYAYDLDQEAGLRNASTFQAWGRRGADKQLALSLGVFYEDNTSKKRWVLKFDDPKALATIDAVFVTVEPNGGSHHPSGKELLFAYLGVNPNHP